MQVGLRKERFVNKVQSSLRSRVIELFAPGDKKNRTYQLQIRNELSIYKINCLPL